MKTVSNLLKRLRHRAVCRRGKKGASLALVMIVGALLVIWVMCIMPLMSTTGTVAYDTQASLLSYLDNRSAIEYCKSELIYMAQTEVPSTFAVMSDGTGKYFVKHKKSSGHVINDATGYQLYVSSPTDNDLDDVPQTSAEGNQVAAICAVQYNMLTFKYDIIISTYNNGVPGMKFNASFTPSGTLKIRPEAYNSGDALPLSDFVLVDGKLGPKTVWNSTIFSSNKSNRENLKFRESMLPVELESDWDYANSGEYPAVFKTTAHTANAASSEIGDILDLGYLSSSEEWKEPKAVTASATKSAGNIWYTLDGNNIKIHLQANADVDITGKCKIYVNGTASSTLPTKIGYYTIAVDFPGTDYSSDDHISKYKDGEVNVLPIAGLTLGTVNKVDGKHDTHNIDTYQASVQKIEEVKTTNTDGTEIITYTVHLGHSKDAEGNALWDENLMYGCVTNADKDNVVWQNSNVFSGLNGEDVYSFYICIPASFNINTGKFTAASAVNPAGMIFKPIVHSGDMTAGKYAIATVSGNTYNFLNTNLSGITTYQADLTGFLFADISGYTWNVADSDGKWSFQNADEKYLNITGQLSPSFNKVENVKHQHLHTDLLGDKYGYCTQYNYVGFTTENPSVSMTESATQLSVSRVGNTDTFEIFRYLSTRFEFRPFDECTDYKYNEYNPKQYKDASQNINLSLTGSGVSAAPAIEGQANPVVKLIRIPVVTKTNEVPGPSKVHTVTSPVTYQPDGITLNFSGNPNVTAVYANGQKITPQDGRYVLNAGSYEIVIEAARSGYSYYANAGRLTVNKASLSSGLSVGTLSADASDDMVIHVPISGRHADNGGYAWFAFKDSAGYHWFSSEDASYPFRLEYGSYSFAVKETGSVNYEGATSADVTGSVDAKPVSLTESDRPHFMFTLDTSKEGTHKGSGVTWYKLPKGLNTARIQEYRFTYDGRYTDYTFTRSKYEGDQVTVDLGLVNAVFNLTTIEIHVSNSEYSQESGKWYQITNRLTVDDVNGHRQSLVKGSSLYFMGNDFSINTHGCRVDLWSDLIVLNSDITNGGYNDASGNPTHGSIYVHPYSETGNKVLIFAVKDIKNTQGTTIFNAKTFYEIPVSDREIGLDINKADFTVDSTWVCPISPNSEHLRNILYSGKYPVVNLDVAYASREQLGRIISSETMKWTTDGVLSGTSNDTNAEYCVPAYITSISGGSSYKANRVLIAAGGSDNSLAVPSPVTFTTRYLSVDAVELSRTTDNGSFVLKNLGQDDGLIQKLGALFGITKSYSKTLQMDFERDTKLTSGSVVVTMPTQICRFSDNTDLFANDLPLQKQPLTAEYKPSEIEALFKKQHILDFQWFKTVKIVDRYIELKPETDGETSINLGARLKGELDLYTNYLYVDPKITTINMTGGSNDIVINSHESGFTEQEYLGIFKGHTGDSYSGTILYFKNGLTVNYSGGKQVVINPGFYYIDAVNNGVALSDFNSKAVLIPESSLKDIAVYIDPNTGKISDSYIDTGLDDNESVGIGGFSGGTVG